MATGTVTVEFFGIPRQRAGRAEIAVEAGTVAELLARVERACPGLRGLVGPGGRLGPHYLLSIEGGRFVTDEQEPLAPGTHVLLLSADAGG
ncbi:MAG: MoaD/ThiS family protein [Gemmataceae bacterium]|nr:MoaD/ThiS family protein [Gemmataceae bacterium]